MPINSLISPWRALVRRTGATARVETGVMSAVTSRALLRGWRGFCVTNSHRYHVWLFGA
ncbi:hypothetical protein BaRGS_00014450, partial [Batillaria attramentaria]